MERQELLDRTAPSLPRDFKIHNLDFRKLGQPDRPGVGATGRHRSAMVTEHEELRKPFAETVARILKPGGFACVYCGHFHLKEFMDVLCGAGLEYRWLIACVNEGTMGAIRSSGSILTFWRPVLLFQKPGGRAKTPRLLRDLIQSKSREKDAARVAAADRRGGAVRQDAERAGRPDRRSVRLLGHGPGGGGDGGRGSAVRRHARSTAIW